MIDRRLLGTTIGVALAVLLPSTVVAATTDVPGPEELVFDLVNGLPAGLEWIVWVPMQFGAILAVPAVALVAWLVWRRWRPPVALLTAGLAAWLIAKALKEVADRGRPATYLDDVELRGGSVGGGHNQGLGFPSGHASIAFALATVAACWLPNRHRWAAFALAIVVGFGRMYFGAHLPLDVVGGAGLGIALGGATLLVVHAVGGPQPEEAEGTAAGASGSRRQPVRRRHTT